MKKFISILKILSNYSEDFFIFLGLVLIVTATFMINKIAGIYVLGFLLIFIGVLIARKPKERR